jgi:Flp pilus assembly pilin Flp
MARCGGKTVLTAFFRLLNDERGAAVAEYGLVAACFALSMIVVLGAIQTESGGQLSGTQTRLTNAANLRNGSF